MEVRRLFGHIGFPHLKVSLSLQEGVFAHVHIEVLDFATLRLEEDVFGDGNAHQLFHVSETESNDHLGDTLAMLFFQLLVIVVQRWVNVTTVPDGGTRGKLAGVCG